MTLRLLAAACAVTLLAPPADAAPAPEAVAARVAALGTRLRGQDFQDHGKLRAFYQAFAADTADRTGEAALVRVLGHDLPTIEHAFVAWARTLRR